MIIKRATKRKPAVVQPLKTRFSIVVKPPGFGATRVFADGVELHGLVSVTRKDNGLELVFDADQVQVLGAGPMPKLDGYK